MQFVGGLLLHTESEELRGAALRLHPAWLG